MCVCGGLGVMVEGCGCVVVELKLGEVEVSMPVH